MLKLVGTFATAVRMSHPRPVPTCERGRLRAAAISVAREASAASSVNERECVIDCARECNMDMKCERARARKREREKEGRCQGLQI